MHSLFFVKLYSFHIIHSFCGFGYTWGCPGGILVVDLLPHTNIPHTHSPGLVEASVHMGGRDQSMCD